MNVPGPGHYGVPENKLVSTNWGNTVFSKSTRHFGLNKINKDGPDPGTYRV